MCEKIIVLRGKHEDMYFAADTKEDIHKFALYVVENIGIGNYGYYYNPPEDITKEWAYKHYGYDKVKSEEEIDALPTDEERVKARNLRKAFKQWEAERKADREFYALAEKAVREKNGDLAFQIVTERQDHEYEEWSYERLVDA